MVVEQGLLGGLIPAFDKSNVVSRLQRGVPDCRGERMVMLDRVLACAALMPVRQGSGECH